MTPGNRPSTAPDVAAGISVSAGAVTAQWCPTCKANTLLLGEVLVIAPGGVARVAAWQWCEICEDPALQEEEKCCGN